MHRDEDAKDDADERREKRSLQKDAEAGGRKQSPRQRTLDSEISQRAWERGRGEMHALVHQPWCCSIAWDREWGGEDGRHAHP